VSLTYRTPLLAAFAIPGVATTVKVHSVMVTLAMSGPALWHSMNGFARLRTWAY
jgi:hypothetical protein